MKKISNKQRLAFEKVVTAIRDAQKQGLAFYGKQEKLVAYTKEASNYIVINDLTEIKYTGNAQIECLAESLLTHSGADDYPMYLLPHHNPNYKNP